MIVSKPSIVRRGRSPGRYMAARVKAALRRAYYYCAGPVGIRPAAILGDFRPEGSPKAPALQEKGTVTNIHSGTF